MGGPIRIFFAADLHGSEPTFQKFLTASSFYEADALVFGGDLMGKAFVPIVRDGDRYRAEFAGEPNAFDADGLVPFTRAVDRAGFYWRVMEHDEYREASADPMRQQGLFQEAARSRLASWIEQAEDRLANTPVRMYLTGGNDDDPAVLEVLDAHAGERVVACEGRTIDLDEEHTMVTVGWSTPTPWDTPREAPEESIAAMIENAVANVPDLGRCVFNFHCPPKDTPIDLCLRLDDTTPLGPGELPKPDRSGGRFHYVGGGSVAVREAVRRHQPLAGLHGHIHESHGWIRLGRTRCFNPGSEYGQGRLQGWIVGLRGAKVTGFQHTSG